MRKCPLLFGVLATGLAVAGAQAAILDTVALIPVFTDDFSTRAAGQNWEDGITWGLSGDAGLAKMVADPLNTSNVCGQILPHTSTGTHYSGVFLNQTLLPAAHMADYRYNALSFKVQLPTGQNWDNWDKAVQVKWSNGGSTNYAYGTDIGTGFSVASEGGVGKAQGSFGYGTSKAGGNYVAPGHAYHTALTDPNWKADFDGTGWTTLTMAWDRATGLIEWYRNGVVFASRQVLTTDPDYAEWVWGSNVPIDPNDPRSMEWLDVGAWGRYQSTTSSILFDDFVVSYGVPEPGTLMLLLGALPLLRRRR